MNRKQFFGNLVGVVGVATNAKQLASIKISSAIEPVVIKQITTTYNRVFVSALDPFLDTREINKMVTDMYNNDLLNDILK